MTRIFYRGADCVFLTYDITNEESFDNLGDWLIEIRNHAPIDTKIYLVGNKSENTDERKVHFNQAIEFAKENNIHKCFETSALSGLNVEKVFSCAAKDLLLYKDADIDGLVDI